MASDPRVEIIVMRLREIVDEIGLQESIARVERRIIEQALDEADGNCNVAARRLKLGRTTLVEKRRKHRLPLARKWARKDD